MEIYEIQSNDVGKVTSKYQYESVNNMRTIKSDSTVVFGLCVSKGSWCRDLKHSQLLCHVAALAIGTAYCNRRSSVVCRSVCWSDGREWELLKGMTSGFSHTPPSTVLNGPDVGISLHAVTYMGDMITKCSLFISWGHFTPAPPPVIDPLQGNGVLLYIILLLLISRRCFIVLRASLAK